MEEEEVTFWQNRMPYTSFIAFEEMRKKGELCDLTLNIQNSTIVAHRVVLAAAIPYFRSLFTKDDANETQEKEIAIADLDHNALESLIHFAYSSRVNITVENVHSLLLASDFLQLTDVAEACVEFMSRRLHVSSIVEVCTFAHSIKNRKLTESCNSCIQQNFEEFSKSEDFLSLPYHCVKDVTSQDELNVPNEETVFEAVINWVKFKLPERQDMLPDLLKEVRMTSFPVGYLIRRVATEELIRSSTACKDLIQDVQSYHLLPENERSFLNLNVVPRRRKREEIYAICSSTSHGYSVYRCDFASNTWHQLTSDMSHKGSILRIVGSNEHIYVFLLDEIKTFHLKTLEWETLKSKSGNIAGSTVLAHGSLIYWFGSLTASLYNKVRCFDTLQKKWLEERKMENGRANVATISVSDTIYVTGGFWDPDLFNIAEKYIPSTGQWCQLPSMLAARSLHSCASINGKIYVFGGCVRKTKPGPYSSSGEIYDPLTNLWNSVSPMRTERARHTLVAFSGKIYAFGGANETENPVLQAEWYDPIFDRWNPSLTVPKEFETVVLM